MRSSWPAIPLGDVLIPVSRPESVEPDKTYRLLGARWYALGLFTKDSLSGSSIRASKLYRVEEGDFVYNRLFAWKGSFAIASKDNHGCYVSNEFPCFRAKEDRLDGRFLWRYMSQATAWSEAFGLSTGGTPTSRNRLKEHDLLGMKIPLPPLPEQRRIVGRIEGVAGRIEEAQQLREEVIANQDRILRSILLSDQEAKPTPLKVLVRLREPDVTVRPEESYQFAGVYCFGRGVFRGRRLTGSEFSYARLTRLRTGNFVYPKLMAWEGAFGIVPPQCAGCVVSTEFPVFEVDPARVLPEVLDVHFRSPSSWPQIAEASSGTNVRRRRLNPQDFLGLEIPVPSPHIQQRLRIAQQQMANIQHLRTETSDTIDALLPSVLDRAFKGEL